VWLAGSFSVAGQSTPPLTACHTHSEDHMPFVRATVDFETCTHNLRKGQLVDLPAEQAEAAIKRGDAVAASVEDAIDQMNGVQRATAGPDARPIKRGS